MLNKRVKLKRLHRTVAIGAVLVSLAVCLPLQAEDQESIAALRNIGKAFASIAEQASPAVVAIQVS